MDNLDAMERAGLNILRTLIDNGYEAYFVGGYVRDKLLGRPIGDIDIATSAKPDEVMRIFERHVPTGLQHGTVTVFSDEFPFEVTTFRTEAEYEQYRRPKSVQYVNNLHEDLKRRDFTMNAMAMDAEGNVLDPFGGQADLKQKLLRCVGTASDRFSEDALRMMRCIRFAAEYGLEVEEKTWQALLHHSEKLKHIAMERVRIELEKMIEGSDPARAITLLQQSGLLFRLNRDILVPSHSLQRIIQHDSLLTAFNRVNGAAQRWYLFYMMLGMSSEISASSMQRLTFSNAAKEAVVSMLRFNEALAEKASDLRLHWIKNVLKFGAATAERWLHAHAMLPDSNLYTEKGAVWLEQMPVKHVQELAVNGNDLKTLKAKSGPWIGKLMNEILLAAASGVVPNEYEAQMQFAKNVLNGEKDEHQ